MLLDEAAQQIVGIVMVVQRWWLWWARAWNKNMKGEMAEKMS